MAAPLEEWSKEEVRAVIRFLSCGFWHCFLGLQRGHPTRISGSWCHNQQYHLLCNPTTDETGDREKASRSVDIRGDPAAGQCTHTCLQGTCLLNYFQWECLE